MRTLIPGPTYAEMVRPEILPEPIRTRAAVARGNELDPANLFNISWRSPDNRIRHVHLPKELSGVAANILVLIGRDFPSGSHKVGPAYAAIMESEIAGEVEPGASTIISPSTGNFGIGATYVAKLKGLQSIVVMPKEMSEERYRRIRHYGGQLDLTPGCESDVILVLERTQQYKKDFRNKVLGQFELFSNYRFHRYVTGQTVLELASQYGNGRVAAFVAAPGSAGTLGAADEIKACFPECFVVALEPLKCPTLFRNGCGKHLIEGIGDKMVSLIHNVLSTDYVGLIHDEDCLIGLALLELHQRSMERILHLPEGRLDCLRGLFGVSGICNIIGSICMARFLGLGPDDNVVTIATDGFDRYPSVLIERRKGPFAEEHLADSFEAVFRGREHWEMLDVRPSEQKKRLFRQKEEIWNAFNYSRSYLGSMQSQSFWEAEYAKIPEIDASLARARQIGRGIVHELPEQN